MYKYHHDLLPSIFSDFYVQNKSVHEYHTRQEHLLHVPLIRTAPLSKTVRVTGVSLYNHFKSLICLKVSYVKYKYNLKRHIIGNDILHLLKASWSQLPWCIIYYSNNYQNFTMEALSFLYQDQCSDINFGICATKGVQMAWSADQPSILVFNLKNNVWAHMGVPIQQHYSGCDEFI